MTTYIEGRQYKLYRLIFDSLNWTLNQGTTYWLASGARQTGSFTERSFFAYPPTAGRVCDIRISPGQKIDFTPSPQEWTNAYRDFAFRIAPGAPHPLNASANVVATPVITGASAISTRTATRCLGPVPCSSTRGLPAAPDGPVRPAGTLSLTDPGRPVCLTHRAGGLCRRWPRLRTLCSRCPVPDARCPPRYLMPGA